MSYSNENLDPPTTNDTNNELHQKSYHNSIEDLKRKLEAEKRLSKSAENIILLPGTERIVKISRRHKHSMETEEILDTSNEFLNGPSVYEGENESPPVVMRKKHMSMEKMKRIERMRKSRQPKSSDPPNTSESKQKPANLTLFMYDKDNPNKRVITSLEVKVPEPVEADWGPTANEVDECYDDVFSPRSTQLLDRDHDNLIEVNKRKTLPALSRQSGIFTPKSPKLRSIPRIRKHNRSRSSSSLKRPLSDDFKGFQKTSICPNCQLASCPNCQQILQLPYDVNGSDVFDYMGTGDRHSKKWRMSTPQFTRSYMNEAQTSPGTRHKYLSLNNLRFRGSTPHLHRYHGVHPSYLQNIDFAKSLSSLNALDNSFDRLTIDSADPLSNVHILGIEYSHWIDPNDTNAENYKPFLSREKLVLVVKFTKELIAKAHDEEQMASTLKFELDKRFGESWHTIVSSDSYGSNIASLPGTLVNYKIDKWVFLIWQT